MLSAAELLVLSGVRPQRDRAMIRSLKYLRWILQKNGFDAYIPEEALRKVHMDLHVAARDTEDAARIARRLIQLYGLKLKKKFENGTHLLFMPHLVAVTVGKVRERLGDNPGKIVLTIAQLRAFRDEVLANIRKHCLELYKRGMNLEACKAAATIAAAEVADVLKERFGIEI